MMTATPTPKQVRFHYKRVMRLQTKLAKAMCDAHNAGVIQYHPDKFSEESPGHPNYETYSRLIDTTEKALAQAMRLEIMNEK